MILASRSPITYRSTRPQPNHAWLQEMLADFGLHEIGVEEWAEAAQ